MLIPSISSAFLSRLLPGLCERRRRTALARQLRHGVIAPSALILSLAGLGTSDARATPLEAVAPRLNAIFEVYSTYCDLDAYPQYEQRGAGVDQEALAFYERRFLVQYRSDCIAFRDVAVASALATRKAAIENPDRFPAGPAALDEGMQVFLGMYLWGAGILNAGGCGTSSDFERMVPIIDMVMIPALEQATSGDLLNIGVGYNQGRRRILQPLGVPANTSPHLLCELGEHGVGLAIVGAYDAGLIPSHLADLL